MINEHFVQPKVFYVGATNINIEGILEYLRYTNQEEFIQDINKAQEEGLDNGEILCSFYAKLCYASLTDKKNKNISKVRSIHDNILSILDSQHGSVLEHCSMNFIVTNCSRVFTHELVRHRVGTAFSQTSGRYVRSDVLNLVIDPILEPVYQEVETIRTQIETAYKNIEKVLGLAEMTDFTKKKKLTSAMRRILPNGQANEIGVTINLRTLRQTIEARTSRHAEWEIREIFWQIYQIVVKKYSIMFTDAQSIDIDGLPEIIFKNKKI